MTYPPYYTPTPDVNDCKSCGKDSCANDCRPAVKNVDIPGVGTIHVVTDPKDVQASRGKVWTHQELALVTAMKMSKENARIIAEAKMIFDGTVESSKHA